MRLLDYVKSKGIGFAREFYFDTKKNLYDTLTVMPNNGRGLRVTTCYDGIPTDPNNYYIIQSFKPDKGLHYMTDSFSLKLERVVNGCIDPHKGVNPEWFLCLPWKCLQSMEESKSIYDDEFAQLAGGSKKEEFFNQLDKRFGVQ